MKQYKLRYFANHYSNGGNWTHIVTVYEKENQQNKIIQLEEDRATDIKKKMQPYLSGNNIFCLSESMKYKQDYYCSLLLSEKDCESLKNSPHMQTYLPRH